ncbi:phage scaffold protein [Carnobacteriaceae bacterium zg-ZUI240]|nr:phage scaffold protein [Carnobacteriaceae bacterium zg-ZUI240]
MSEFKTIETQDELDAIIKHRLQREGEKFADYETIKTRVIELEKENTSYKSALEESKSNKVNFEKQINELTNKISGYELSSLKTRVALQNGLPYELAERLQGADEKELTEDAERLSNWFKVNEPVAPLKSTEQSTSLDGNDSVQDVYRSLAQNINLN